MRRRRRSGAPRQGREHRALQVQVEVDRIDQIEPALAAGADRLLLDNMPPPVLREAVALVAGRVPLEASGGVNLDTIRAIAETGVDFISVGRITQSAPAVDIGLDYSMIVEATERCSFEMTGYEEQQLAEWAARPLRPTRLVEEYFDEKIYRARAFHRGLGRPADRRDARNRHHDGGEPRRLTGTAIATATTAIGYGY